MNTNQLDYFMHACREGSFTAAARRVPMSAQGLAKAIHSLEAELGVALFTPGDNGAQRPTPYAEELRVFCEERAAAFDRMREGFRRIDGQARERIALAASIGSLGLLGMEFLSDFKRANPGVEVICDDLPDVRVEDSLRAGLDTLGITVLPTPDEFETVELASCERYVWVSAADPLARRRFVEARDLSGYAVAGVGPLFKGYWLLLEEARRAGADLVEVVTSPEMGWLHQFARDGRGVALTAQTVVPLYEDDASVVALPVRGMPYAVGISWLKSHELTAMETRLVEAAVQRCAAHREPSWRQALRELLAR